MSPTTGTTGTIRHPDVSEISDLTEGLLSPSRTAEIRSHLDDCALCADVRASLDEIRSLLGTLPGPARMPVDIAGRIDAALAAEALLDATTPHEGTKRPRENGGHTAPEVRPRATDSDVSRETSGARRPSGHPAGPSGSGRRRARRRIAVLTGLVSAAACALGIFLFSDLSGTPTQDTSARTGTSSSDTGASTGTYTAQGLQDSVHRLLPPDQGSKTVPGDQNSPYGVENSPPSAGVAPGDRQAPPPVPACVQQATGRPDSPLAAERGSYRGIPVYLLVLPHPGDPANVDAYLVDTACETTGAATGKLLLTNTYPRT
ncbi:hypothetical protein OG625_19300 [Streptomyces sp. NBC_01351]|uniref:hypothetical protein n=1 Tax=Streptomyces sp. NBC_01351 TaxID=2903833 RepID=UPI002E364A01|nr:hypothetical protein [Streptomyces sp. NBC_01351]